MSTAAYRYDIDGLNAACQALHDANERLQAALPSPDADLNTALQNAIDDFDTSAHFCIAGTTSIDPDLINQATIYLQKANDHIGEANAILQKYE